MGKIQNEDIKSSAELVTDGGAENQLPNDDKAYLSALGINKVFKTAIEDGRVNVVPNVFTVASTGAHFASLQAAHDSAKIVSGSKIVVFESAALNAAVAIIKPDIEIEFRPGVTYSKGGGAPTRALTLSSAANGVIIRGGRFSGFSGGSDADIEVDAAAEHVRIIEPRFASGENQDIITNSNPTLVITSPINET